MKDEELQVNCPHLLIWGKKDTALLQESYRGLENYCNDLKIVTLDDADQIIEMLSSEIEEREQVIDNVIKKANVASLKRLDTPTLKPASATLRPIETTVLKPQTTTLMPAKARVLKPSDATLTPANNVLIPQENNEVGKIPMTSIADIAKEEIAQQKLEEE